MVSKLSVIGLPLAIAVAGSVGNLVMMSHQRNAELAFAAWLEPLRVNSCWSRFSRR